MDISIIIVNYNKYELTENCIDSIINNRIALEYEIIVVDNSSTNNSYQYLFNKYKNINYIHIIKNEKNDGFGIANNIGVTKAESDYILLLNPDVTVPPYSIEKMLNRIQKDDSIGVLGCKLLNDDMTLQYSCRSFIKFSEFLLCRTPLRKFVTKSYLSKVEDKYLLKEYNHQDEKDVDWLMGSCLLFKKEVFLRVNGFSTDYFMYFEDVDICYKIHKIDKKVLYYPIAEMIHLHNQESVKKINKLTVIHFSSMLKFYKKFYWNI